MEKLLKGLEEALEKESNGENIDQELIKMEPNGQWILEKGLKSKLANVFGKIKERIKGEINPSLNDKNIKEPTFSNKKSKIKIDDHEPKLSKPVEIQDRKLSPKQAKSAGLPPAPKAPAKTKSIRPDLPTPEKKKAVGKKNPENLQKEEDEGL